MDLSAEILSQITVFMKYAKYLPDKGRRETWEECVARNKEMHKKKYPEMSDFIEDIYKMVEEKKVLPSMRALQFSGRPIELSPNRIYNCGFLPIDHPDAFSEIMFLLLGGTGVGFSVQKHHVEKLPEIRKPKANKPYGTRRYLIGDSIEGWADSIKVLMRSFFEGSSDIIFDFSDIRPKGSRLVTSGGKAPGPEPLKICLRQIKSILNEKKDGSQLTTLEVHDIVNHIADAVLAGGIRRAALISLFSVDDEEMMSCKFGKWYEKNPQRARANNSVVLVRHKIEEEKFKEIWKKIEQSKSGEPGIYFTNDKDWGTNPSLRSGTRVLTTNGIEEIQNLQDREFFVKNLNGEISKAKCWLSGKDKQLYKLTLKGGHEYFATAEHEWPVWNGKEFVKVSSNKLESGNLLPVIRENKLFEGKIGNYEDGFVLGWQYGSGHVLKHEDDKKVKHSFIVSEKDAEYDIDTRIETYISKMGSNVKFSNVNSTKELDVINNALNENMLKFTQFLDSNMPSFGLPKSIWSDATEEFRKGFIDGLFSSNGHAELNKKSISLISKHSHLIKDVSELLGFYGIKSSVSEQFAEVNGEKSVEYVLNIIEGASVKHFRNLFRLSIGYKQEQIDAYEFPCNIQNNMIEIVDIEKTDIHEDVWDISVFDKTHCFQIAHCITGNCCEIALRPFQFCNLTEVNVSDVETQEELESRVSAAAFIGTLQAGYTDFHYLRPIWRRTTERDALVGIGMTGIGSGKVQNLDIERAVKIAEETNHKVAKMIGIKSAARITCIKPSGTTSLVLGCSSGIHAWHNDYYIRRLRVGKNESIYTYLLINHPELVEDEYFRPHDTAIISVPMKAPEGSITRHESALSLLERVKFFSEKWVKPGHKNGSNTHNISATVSVKDDEWEEVGDWMWENREFYNGLSVLPYDGGTYIQAPHEDCTEEEYERLIKHLEKIDLTKVIELDDNTDLSGELACSGGSCSIDKI